MRAVLGMVALEHEGETIRTNMVASCLPLAFATDEAFYRYTLGERQNEFIRVDTEYGPAVEHRETGTLVIPRSFHIVVEVYDNE